MNYDLGIRTLDAYNQIKPTDIFDKKDGISVQAND